jgi:hypothetical protein
MPNPLAFLREEMLNSRAQMSFNPSESGNNERVEGLLFHTFESATDLFGGEAWAAGDILIGDLLADNFVLRSGIWRMRYQDETQITMGRYGMRINAGGLGLNQVETEIGMGVIDLDENGDFMRTSYLAITVSTGAFSINSIAEPTHQNQILIIKNKTANNMTIVDAGVPPTGYWTIETQDGSSPSTTGKGIAYFIGNEVDNCWELISIRG